MRKTIATVILTGALVVSGAPVAADETDTCGSSAIGDAPVVTSPVGTSCQERVYELEAEAFVLESKIRSLQFRVFDLRWQLRQQRKEIRRQDRVIRHLRAELRDARG